jgi:6-phosphogluconolactonase
LASLRPATFALFPALLNGAWKRRLQRSGASREGATAAKFLAAIRLQWFRLAARGALAFPWGMKRTVFIGTYTNGGSKGIYSCRFDSETGALDDPRLAAETESPSFLALHPNRKVLYAVNETEDFEGGKSGSVTAFAITDLAGGVLKKLNAASSEGGWPCHLAISPRGNSMITANYAGGTVGVLALNDDGSLGESLNVIRHEGSSVNKERQEGPHPHSVTIDPSGKFVFVADLGLDLLVKYELGNDGRLSERKGAAKVAPGSGPRHFAFRPDGKFAYVINEMLRTVTAFAYEAETGTLTEIQTISTVPEGWREGSTAELFPHPSGRFLYGSNRGHDSIAAFRIDEANGKLALIEIEKTGGRTPRNFNLDPGGRFLIAANQTSGDLHVFSIDPGSGALEPETGRIEVPSPVCVVFAT